MLEDSVARITKGRGRKREREREREKGKEAKAFNYQIMRDCLLPSGSHLNRSIEWMVDKEKCYLPPKSDRAFHPRIINVTPAL